MIDFTLLNDFIYSATSLFAYIQSSHEASENFISTFGRMVNKTERINKRFARISYFYSIAKYFNHWRSSFYAKILVD